jgi:uncharacterized membrane protein
LKGRRVIDGGDYNLDDNRVARFREIRERRTMSPDLIKTTSYLGVHLTVGFAVAYLLTGSVEIAGGIALIEPCVNAVAFYFHEKAWRKKPAMEPRLLRT